MKMRRYYSELKLAEIAQKTSVVYWHSSDGSRHKPRKEERRVFYNIFYGALLTLNYGEKVRLVGSDKSQAICDCAEAQMRLFFPVYNWYDSIYIPLKEVIVNWETEDAQ